MRGLRILALAIVIALGAALGVATAGYAAGSRATSTTGTTTTAPPPANDDRDNATDLGALPAAAGGTTVGATVEDNEPFFCNSYKGSVWYSITFSKSPPPNVGVELQADGDLDATVAVFEQMRSDAKGLICKSTDKHGLAGLTFAPSAGQTYLIRVQPRVGSYAGTFSLHLFSEPAAPTPPGAPLGPRGAKGKLNAIFNPQAAWSARLQAATTYRINLVNRNARCVRVAIYGPGTGSWDAGALSSRCAGYRLFTPEVSGRYSFLVSADASLSQDEPYALSVAPASSAEMAPGIPLPNLGTYTGRLRGNVDTDLRLFSFSVAKRSQLTLRLADSANAAFNLELLSQGGRILDCACGGVGDQQIQDVTRPGRYYAVVQAENFGYGRFGLERQSRTITSLAVLVNGRGAGQIRPGQSVTWSARVRPAEAGAVTFTVQYFDPIAGWQFRGNFTRPVTAGVATLPFTPAAAGHWRATATYAGTRTAAPATGRYAELLDVAPLSG